MAERKADKQARDDAGRLASQHTPEEREAITADACQQIMLGYTVEQVAAQNGITTRTLHHWLHALGDEYERFRRTWLDSMLIEAGEGIEGAEDPLQIARARELWKRATWYAERRDPNRYAAKQPTVAVQINNSNTISADVDPVEAARLYRELVGGR